MTVFGEGVLGRDAFGEGDTPSNVINVTASFDGSGATSIAAAIEGPYRKRSSFGNAVFGQSVFGGGGVNPITITVQIPLSIEVTLSAVDVSAAEDIDVAASFDALGLLSGDPSLESNALGVALAATGGLLASPEVAPLGSDVSAGSVALAAAGAVLVGDPTVVGPGGTDVDVGLVGFSGRTALYAESVRVRVDYGRVLLTTPTPEVLAALEASVIKVWRVVDILEADESPWRENVGFSEGSVTVELDRDERRMFSLKLDNFDGDKSISPDNLWYDKIFRIRRGVSLEGTNYEFNLGHFMVDQPNGGASSSLDISGRDYSKRMLNDKLEVITTFPTGTTIESIIKAVALNSGTKRLSIPQTGIGISAEASFDADTSRWDVAKQVANDYGYNLYFDRGGTLTMEEQQDPVTTAPTITIGGVANNAISFSPTANDGQLFNHIVVVGTGGSSDEIPVWASVENNEPSSPTRVERIGRRTKRVESALVTTEQEAMALAIKMLKVAALEQFSVSFSSLNYPWLDVGSIIELTDPDAGAADPTRFLLTSLTIPLGVGLMEGTCKRVTVVGGSFVARKKFPKGVDYMSNSVRMPVGLDWGDGE